MHHTTSARVGAASFIGVMAMALAACVAPTAAPSASPTTSPSVSPTAIAPSTPSSTESAAPGEPAGPSATAQPDPEPQPTIEPEPDPTPAADGTVSLELLSAAYDPATGAVTAAAMVVDRITDAGTCTLTVTQDAQTATASGAGRADANVTYCADLTAQLPAGASGTWTVTIDFTEAGFSGTTTGEVVAG
jgi:hypothetical protein